ncbi:MAG: hypothetical protein WDZ49_01640, partial [Litorilinea sp.]
MLAVGYLLVGFIPAHAQDTVATVTPGADSTAALYNPDSMLMGLQPGADLEQVEAYLAAQGLTLIHYWPELEIVHVAAQSNSAGAGEVRAAADRQTALESSNLFRFVE